MNAHIAENSQFITIDTDRPGIPLFRLVGVEIRKAFNTRAGLWYTISILALCLIVMLFLVFAFPDETQSFSMYVETVGGILGYLLPIVSIMLVTQEWGQRTGLVTFALEPRRIRVILAKLIASIVIALAVMAVSFAIAAFGALLASTISGADVSWSLETSAVLTFILGNIIYVLVAFAIATLVPVTAGAIVLYFVYSIILPMVVGIVGFYVEWFGNLVPWIELNTAVAPMLIGQDLTGEQWAQLGTSGLIWLVLPLTLGIIRTLNAEVK